MWKGLCDDGALEKTENNAEEHDGLSFLPGEYENSIYSLIGQHIVDKTSWDE